MAEQPTHDHDAAIGGFRAKLGDCTVRAACGRNYVRTAMLTDWLRGKVGSGSNTTRAARLLLAAYRDRIGPGLPISSEELSSGEACCLVVFSILLELRLGQLVDRFQRLGIVDMRLPVDLLSLQDKVSAMDLPRTEGGWKGLAERFDDMQWRFCPARFDHRVGREHPKNMILPIFKKEEINDKGGTACLWQIAVQEEFVGQKIRDAVRNSRFYDSRDDFGWGYNFALKTFEKCNRAVYINEKEAFIGLKDHDGMVLYLADYGHKEMPIASSRPEIAATGRTQDVTRTTYNILLEYGDCDLDEFFAERLPPVFDTEVEGFWKALFEVADAVEGIHNLSICTDGMKQEYHGWHADIKPDNILSVQGVFKLADPGFVKFVKKTDKVPEECVLGGTETYGAPERYPGRSRTSSAVPQTIDIWSLGCVFSIAATWVVLGYQGIRQFGKMREIAIEKVNKDQSARRRSLAASTSARTASDSFHDGQEVLPDVTSWHGVLRSALRETDTITGRVLDVVDGKMLLGDSRKRSKAKEICKELKQILSQNQARPRKPIPESIMKALLEVDEAAASSEAAGLMSSKSTAGMGQSLTIPQDRKARKSKLLDLPLMKTTHRSEYLKSALSAQGVEQDIKQSVHESPTRQVIPVQPPKHPDSVPTSFSLPPSLLRQHSGDRNHPENVHGPRTEGGGHVPSTASISSTPVRPNLSRRSRTNTPQNVFQAREEVERREKGNILRRVRKDELLTRHFGNRDIKFLVDNGETMKTHWYEATYLLETLVLKAAGQDENGMDLSFTAGPVKVENKKDRSDFTKAMRDPKAQPALKLHTDMRKSLGDIFAKYLEELKNKSKYPYKKDVKDLTLIILTDGIWAGVLNKDEVSQKIINFVKGLAGMISDLRDRPVSIEFIQFGNDEDATYMLRHLDNDLKWEGIPDIIDHEPSCGDVNKMLLGSFVEEYDEDDEDGSPSWGGTAQSMDSPQRLASPVRTSPFQGFSLPDQAPQMSLPTINTHIPPTRPQTRQNTLSMSSSRGG